MHQFELNISLSYKTYKVIVIALSLCSKFCENFYLEIWHTQLTCMHNTVRAPLSTKFSSGFLLFSETWNHWFSFLNTIHVAEILLTFFYREIVIDLANPCWAICWSKSFSAYVEHAQSCNVSCSWCITYDVIKIHFTGVLLEARTRVLAPIQPLKKGSLNNEDKTIMSSACLFTIKKHWKEIKYNQNCMD